MDDMKKLIERYKKELMDMNKSKPQAPPQKEIPRMPLIIGYVDDDAERDKIPDIIAEKIGVEKNAETENITDETAAESDSEGCLEYEEGVDPAPEAEQDGFSEEEAAEEDIVDEPRFVEIPSFQQTREEITKSSVPENNEPAPNASGVSDNSPTTPRADFAEGGTVSEERAEELNRQPVSGTEVGEQLTGRSFPDETTPENPRSDIIREGSRSEPGDFPEPVYEDYADFLAKNTGRGAMSFRVFTAREALPVAGARVIVSKKFGDERYVFFDLLTDSSGETAPQTLPAPDKKLSLDSENKIQPFSLYDGIVSKDGFIDIILTGIPVFDGVSSVQSSAMVPSEEEQEITEVSENAER